MVWSAGTSFRAFLSKTYGGNFARPADLEAELARTLSLIAARLGTDWTPPGPPDPGALARGRREGEPYTRGTHEQATADRKDTSGLARFVPAAMMKPVGRSARDGRQQ